MVDRLAVAQALREIGLFLRARKGNPFRAKAYEKAARALESLGGDLARLVDEGRLTEVPGIGPAIGSQIEEMVRTGRSSQLERLRAELPPGALELLSIPGMSTKRIEKLHAAGVHSAAELRAVLEGGGLAGFSAASMKKMREQLQQWDQREDRMRLVEALPLAKLLQSQLAAAPGVERA